MSGERGSGEAEAALWNEMKHALTDARTRATPDDPKVEAYWRARIRHVLAQPDDALGSGEAERTVVLADVVDWLNERASRYRTDEFAADDFAATALRAAAREAPARFAQPDAERYEGCERRGGVCDCAGRPCAVVQPDAEQAPQGRISDEDARALEAKAMHPKPGKISAERLRSALTRIADGDVDGVGDYSECVQLYARQVLAAQPDVDTDAAPPGWWKAEAERLREALEWIVRVNATEREYKNVARDALRAAQPDAERAGSGDAEREIERLRRILEEHEEWREGYAYGWQKAQEHFAQPDAERAAQGGRTCPECGPLGEWNACPHDVEWAPQPEPRQDEQ